MQLKPHMKVKQQQLCKIEHEAINRACIIMLIKNGDIMSLRHRSCILFYGVSGIPLKITLMQLLNLWNLEIAL